MRAFAGKLAEHAARLAGVLTLVADIGAEEVQIQNMQAGIDLAEHYLSEALRLEAVSEISDDKRLAGELLAWAQKLPADPNGRRLVALVDVYQKGPRSFREQEIAKHIIAILEDHRWLIQHCWRSRNRRREAS